MLHCRILQSRPSRCEAAKYAGDNPDIHEITLQQVPSPVSAFKARDGLSDGGGGHAKPMCGDREASGLTFVLAHIVFYTYIAPFLHAGGMGARNYVFLMAIGHHSACQGGARPCAAVGLRILADYCCQAPQRWWR